MKPDELVVGKTYFHLGYHHPRYPIPSIQAYVYIGKNVYEYAERIEDEYLFKEPEAYYAADFVGVPGFEDCDFADPENKMLLLVEEAYLDNFTDYKGLIAWLEKVYKDENASKIY